MFSTQKNNLIFFELYILTDLITNYTSNTLILKKAQTFVLFELLKNKVKQGSFVKIFKL
jgi:hypothetical protein